MNGLSDIELRWLYENQLVRQGRKARHVYDHIKTNALHGLCSYCQYGTANTLDHFIPVSVVQALSIDPWNLVPACDRCNKLLLATFATQTEQQLLHPYAQPQSVPTDLRWLRASVQHIAPIVITFRAEPDDAVDAVTRDRIINQFDLLRLGDLYQTVSARELAGTCRSLTNRFPGGQCASVTAHLRELSVDAFGADRNDRRGALYEALADDEWFTTIGYELSY